MGPLAGVRVIEMAGIGPAPFCGMLLADMGAEALPPQDEPAGWPVLRARFAAVFKGRTREQWCALLEGTDACFAPVLDVVERRTHPHMASRGALVEVAGVTNSAAAPRFSRTPGGIAGPAGPDGADTERVLAGWGFDAGEVEALRASGVAA